MRMCKGARIVKISYQLQKLSGGVAKEAIQAVWLQWARLEINSISSYIHSSLYMFITCIVSMHM